MQFIFNLIFLIPLSLPGKLYLRLTVQFQPTFNERKFRIFPYANFRLACVRFYCCIPKRLNMSFYFSKEGETQLCTPGQVSSDKADSLGVRFEFMKEGQHHWNKSADWSELSRIHYSCRILTPTKFRRWTEETGLGVKREKKYFIGNKTTC